MKYKDWLADWLANYVKVTCKQRTYNRYIETVNAHIIPKLGECEMNDLTSIELQKFVTELLLNGNKKTGKGLSSSAVNSIITVLQSSLAVAHGLGLIERNPASNIKRPKLTEKQVECFGVSEQKQIEQAVHANKKTYMLTFP